MKGVTHGHGVMWCFFQGLEDHEWHGCGRARGGQAHAVATNRDVSRPQMRTWTFTHAR
jgi:hypothetical protein